MKYKSGRGGKCNTLSFLIKALLYTLLLFSLSAAAATANAKQLEGMDFHASLMPRTRPAPSEDLNSDFVNEPTFRLRIGPLYMCMNPSCRWQGSATGRDPAPKS